MTRRGVINGLLDTAKCQEIFVGLHGTMRCVFSVGAACLVIDTAMVDEDLSIASACQYMAHFSDS